MSKSQTPDAVGTKPLKPSAAAAASSGSVPVGEEAAKTGATEPVEILTPSEQMARFAKEQKENDWGHQPC